MNREQYQEKPYSRMALRYVEDAWAFHLPMIWQHNTCFIARPHGELPVAVIEAFFNGHYGIRFVDVTEER